MKFVIAFLIVILSFQAKITAQERDTLVVKTIAPGKEASFPENSGMQMSPGSISMPILFQDLKIGSNFQNPALPNMDFNQTSGWRAETGNSMSFISRFPFGGNPSGLYRRSVWDIYQGIYGIHTYQLNSKFSIGTAGYSEKSFNEYSLKSGIYRQTNYSSSLFVGYKFSEKFSISAGFTIQRNGDPLNRNQGMMNGGMFP